MSKYYQTKAVEMWGEEAQLNQLIEECGELIVAINHRRRDRATTEEVLEEMADVQLMLEQFHVIYGDLYTEVLARKQTKFFNKVSEALAKRGLPDPFNLIKK